MLKINELCTVFVLKTCYFLLFREQQQQQLVQQERARAERVAAQNIEYLMHRNHHINDVSTINTNMLYVLLS